MCMKCEEEGSVMFWTTKTVDGDPESIEAKAILECSACGWQDRSSITTDLSVLEPYIEEM